MKGMMTWIVWSQACIECELIFYMNWQAGLSCSEEAYYTKWTMTRNMWSQVGRELELTFAGIEQYNFVNATQKWKANILQIIYSRKLSRRSKFSRYQSFLEKVHQSILQYWGRLRPQGLLSCTLWCFLLEALSGSF